MVTLETAITRAVAHAGGNGVTLDELEALIVRADPALATSPYRRHRTSEVLAELQRRGLVRLPRDQRQWDRTGVPALPNWVRPPLGSLAKSPSSQVGVPADLRPELASARQLGLISPDERETLNLVNAWLVRRSAGSRPLMVSHRERSLEVFGHEKRLDTMVNARLFTSGVLSFELLSCVWRPPLLTVTRVSDVPTALVVENVATFHSLVDMLMVTPGPVGVVVYGAGNAFTRTVTGLLDPDVGRLTHIWYFGDLDVTGLRIPQAASNKAVEVGLPLVLPQLGLYRLLLAHGRSESTGVVSALDARTAAAWLGTEAATAELVLTAGNRLAQEAVGLELLSGHADTLWD